jgi:C4-dicarboxylate-binding protein DctP
MAATGNALTHYPARYCARKTDMRKMVVLCALTLTLAWSAAPARDSDAPIVLKFSHVVAENTPKGQAALRFKELAETRTKGRVQIEVYPNSTLFPDAQEIRALQLGAAHILAPSLSKFSPLGVHEFEVFDLPYLFDNYRQLRRVTDGPVGRKLLKKLESKGITGLAYWDNGFKVMSANRPIRNPADFRGMKVRIQTSHVLDAQMRALGSTPQMLAFSEVHRALQKGIVDGTENPPSNLYTQKMHEVQKHVTVSNHGYLGYAVITNKRFWDNLPNDIRRTLEGAMADATKYANEIAKQENDDALEAVRRSGKSTVYVLNSEEKRAWKRVLIPVHREMESRVGADIIHDIYKATEFDPSRL